MYAKCDLHFVFGFAPSLNSVLAFLKASCGSPIRWKRGHIIIFFILFVIHDIDPCPPAEVLPGLVCN
jgi:hypothetical protein